MYRLLSTPYVKSKARSAIYSGVGQPMLPAAAAMEDSKQLGNRAMGLVGMLGMGFVAYKFFKSGQGPPSVTQKDVPKIADQVMMHVAPQTASKAAMTPMLDMEEIARRTVTRKKSSLYTRSGDSGMSQLYNMERRPKCDDAFKALGNMDELNACLALAAEHSLAAGNGLHDMIVTIQSWIIDASALVATPRDSSSTQKINHTMFPAWCTDHLEACIDELDARAPPLRTFVVPGGGLAAAQLHMARCVCRRAERSLPPLLGAGQGVEEVARFINRLSDFLFAAARYASMLDGKPERPWVKLAAEIPAAETSQTTTQADSNTT